jgi:thiamine pyrophosphokinase
VIVAGGDPVPPSSIPHLPDDAYVIAADGGLHTTAALGLAADLVIGDLDSADPAAVAAAAASGAEIVAHPANKDATDLELALEEAVERGLGPATLVGGASFDRIDHFMANALLLASPRVAPLRPRWLVKGAIVIAVHDEAAIAGEEGDLLTLLATGGPATGVTTTGLRWPLDGATLLPGSTRGVSNVLTSPTATVSLTGGTLLAVHQEDRS